MNYVSISPVLLSFLKPIMNHSPICTEKRTFRDKRVDSWLLKLQDTLRQIVEIKYRKGIDNVGPDLLMHYTPLASSLFPTSIAAAHPSTPLSQPVSLSNISSLVSDWPCGTDA